MRTCTECGGERWSERLVPEFVENLGGIEVLIKNAVREITCDACGEQEIEIPDLNGLVRSVAVWRAMEPKQLSGAEVRFMRRALDMTQKEFAAAADVAPETVSRWESGVKGHGSMAEKLIRYFVCAVLHELVPAVPFDPKAIALMRFVPNDGETIRYVVERIRFRDATSQASNAWEFQQAA